ncbi:MAG TPA: tetratricopeptide repeat protein, partial [Thermoanaerobaculia bacterium]|nr:tetratricopeptide repeat protein [Thermoanaerobaculia bacterium]
MMLKDAFGIRRLTVPAVVVAFSLHGWKARADVIVEAVTAKSVAAAAGLEGGDRLISWTVVPRKGVPGPRAKGSLQSPFDLTWIAWTQAPRGTVTLTLTRDASGSTREAVLAVDTPGWGLTTRPVLEGKDLSDYMEGKALAERKDVAHGIAVWSDLAARLEKDARIEDAAWLRLQAANMLAREKRNAQQGEQLTEAVRLSESVPRPFVAAAARVAQGDAMMSASKLAESAESYRGALAIVTKAYPRSLAVTFVNEKIARLEHTRARPDKVVQIVPGVVGDRERLAPGSLALADAYRTAYQFALQRDDLEECEMYARKALRLNEKLVPNSLEVARALNHLATVKFRRGSFSSAEEICRRASKIAESVAPGDSVIAGSLNLLAGIERERTDFDLAESHYLGALKIYEANEDSRNAATVLSNFGLHEEDQGALEQAETYFERALAIQEKLSPESLDVAQTLSGLGYLRFLQERFTDAAAVHRRALAIRRRVIPGSLKMENSLIGLGNALFRGAEYEEAERYLREGLEIREALAPDSFRAASNHFYLGLLYRKKGEVGPALQHFEAAVFRYAAQLTRLGGSPLSRSGFLASNRSAHQNLAEILVEKGRIGDALAVIERLRGEGIRDLASSRDETLGWKVPVEVGRRARRIAAEYDNVAAQIALLRADQGGQERKEKVERLKGLRIKRQEVEGEIFRAAPRLASLVRPQVLDAAGCQAAVPPGTVVLSYAVGDQGGRTLLFVIRRDHLSAHAIEAGTEELANEVRLFRSLLLRGRDVPGLETGLVEAAAHLYDVLVRPALPEIAGASRIVVVPDGPLNGLPFGALVTEARPGSRPRYWIE